MKKYLSIGLGVVFVLCIVIFNFKQSTPDFEQYAAGVERKTAFFDYFLPLIDEKNQEIEQTRAKLLQLSKNTNDIGWWDSYKVKELADVYRVKEFTIEDKVSWQKLLRKVDVLPPSLILAQAANESAWGTSRFAKMGNNYFGQWCFEYGCGLVPKKRDSGKAHEVAAFDSPQESLASYMQNLNRHEAYKSLRQIRAQLRAKNQNLTGISLAAGLSSYSERGEVYIDELREMITFNKLEQYDSHVNNLAH